MTRVGCDQFPVPLATKFLVAIVTSLIFLLLWETAVRTGMTYPARIPTVSRIYTVLGEMTLSGKLWQHTSSSLCRVTVGYVLAVALAIPLGFLVGWFRSCERYLDPPLQALRQVPLLAWFPPFILMFGIGETPKILLLTMTAFWWILIGTMSAVKGIDAEIITTARSLALSPMEMFLKIVIPSIFPSLIASLRLAYTDVILILTAVEVLGGRYGLGCLGGTENYVAILILTVLGLIVNYCLVAVETRCCRWKEQIIH